MGWGRGGGGSGWRRGGRKLPTSKTILNLLRQAYVSKELPLPTSKAIHKKIEILNNWPELTPVSGDEKSSLKNYQLQKTQKKNLKKLGRADSNAGFPYGGRRHYR